MAHFLALKAPAEVVERTWRVPTGHGDSPESASVSASGVTVDTYEINGCGEVALTLSGGSAGETGAITATITTSYGNTLTETLYIPIASADSTASTVRDIVSFALRKVAGLAEEPTAEQAEDARERLADMLEEWRATGADIGATRPLTLNTVLYCPESYLSAVKNNLIVALSDIYGLEVSPFVMRKALAGLAHIKMANLPDDRPLVAYY
jgi:hypothetical protein